MQKYDSLCPRRMFDCEAYAHLHCVDCDGILLAVGEGPVYSDDGPCIDSYEDELKNGAVPCTTCGDESLRCAKCASENEKCAHCREIEAAPCAHCSEPVGATFRYIGSNPQKLVCAGCADCKNCEECRLGAA